MIDKGDAVLVRACIEMVYKANLDNDYRYSNHEIVHEPADPYRNKRCLCRVRWDKPRMGMVCGYTYRRTGIAEASAGNWDDYEPGYLYNIQSHKVWIVQPLGSGRWLKPIVCLEEDLEVMQQKHIEESDDDN